MVFYLKIIKLKLYRLPIYTYKKLPIEEDFGLFLYFNGRFCKIYLKLVLMVWNMDALSKKKT